MDRMRLTQYVHTRWTAEQGLPQNSVFDIVQTRDGYIWLATQSGLARFDGVQFTTFTRRDGLPSDEISTLYEASDGSLWIGTNGGGAARMKDGGFTTVSAKDGLESDLVRAIHETEDGAIWIGTIDGGLHRIHNERVVQYGPEEGLAGNVVLAIHESADGSLWIGTEGGLSRKRGKEFERFTSDEGLPGDLVWTIYEEENGSLWLGTSGGLARYSGGRFEAIAAPEGHCTSDVGALAKDEDGALWIGSLGGGVCRLSAGRFESFTSADGLTNDRVRSLMVDREGNVWAGTERGGFDQFTAGKFTHITTKEGLAHDVVLSTLEDRDGNVWAGTEGAGVSVAQSGRTIQLTTDDGLPSNDIYALAEDAAGDVWVGMYGGGVCRTSRSSDVIIVDMCLGADDGLPSIDVYALYGDRKGGLWIGTLAGLAYYNDGRLRNHAAVEPLAETAISSIHEDRRGDVWVGTYGGSIVRLRGDRVVHYGLEQGLSSDIVLVLHEDATGSIWAGMQGGGLCLLGDTQARCVSTKDGFPTDNVLQLLEDAEGSMWIGTLQGIVRADLEDIQHLINGRRPDLPHAVFDKSSGLKVTEMNGGTQPSAWRGRDGRLWFTTNRGLASINPNDIRVNSIVPTVHVELITIEDEPVPISGAVNLPAGSRDLAFHYTGLSFAVPEEVRFQYKLEGYDDHWIDAGNRREAYYTNLAPGDYTFRVKAANNDGVWNEEGAAVSFYLAPFFYQTWWFKWLCAIAAMAVAAGAYRLRIRQLKQRERELERVVDERTADLRREKEITEQSKRVIEGQAEKLRELDRFKTKFFANVSHEFRTPLTMIVGPLENMLAGLYEPLSAPMKQQAEVMLRNALRLMRLINQLLDLSKLEDGKMKLRARERNLVSFLEGVVLSCSSFAERKQIDLRFEAPAPEIPLAFEPDKFEKVFYNLLSNATKFTPQGGRISVEISAGEPSTKYPEGFVTVVVSDTGRGIPADQIDYVFDRFHQVDGPAGWDHEGTGIGLALVKEMVLLHGGEIGVESELGSGTAFTLTLPLGTQHLASDQLIDGELSDEIAEHGGAMTQLASSDFDYMHEDEHNPAPVSTATADAPVILVVDDNKDVREYVASILTADYRIETACDGAEGLQKAHAVVPDLILSDVMMPNVDGNEFCRRVKSTPALNHIPVVLLTARATHQLKIEGLEVGADDYIPKPFNVNELRVRIKNLLRLRSQEKELKMLNEHLEAKVAEQVDQMLEERRRYEDDLIDAKERAEASDRLKSNILNNLSHEFRTPLTAILGFNEIMQLEGPTDLKQFTFEIERGGKRLLRTLDSLLALSRIETDEVGSGREVLDSNHVVLSVVETYREQAAEKGVDLHFTEAESGEVEVQLSRSAMQQILHNLVDNAVKFTNEGEVSVRVERADGHVLVHVEDTGVGMGEDFLPRMYDAFVQESDGYTRTYEGCGLGLTVAKRLVEVIGGTIHVESKRGAGSRFTVAFPARLAKAA